jgi:hypothetical protein
VQGSGFSRTVTAALTNNGSATATNVAAEVEVYAGDHRVQIDGEDRLHIDVGTVEAGQHVTRDVPLRFSFTDGLRLQASGATFVITIDSDQGPAVFSAEYNP